MREQLLDPRAPWAQAIHAPYYTLHAELEGRKEDPSAYTCRYLLWVALGKTDTFSLWVQQKWREFHDEQQHTVKKIDCVLCGTERTQEPFDNWLFDQLKEKYT